MTTAHDIANALNQLDVKTPKPIAEAIAVYDACVATEVPKVADVNVAALTIEAADVAAFITTAADAQVRTTATMQIRGEMMDRLGRRCHRAVDTSADEITKALRPVFTAAAEAFTTAYAQLPDRWTDADELVKATAHVEAHLEAKRHLPTLAACKRIADALPTTNEPIYRGTRYTTVTDTMVAAEVAKVTRSGTSLGWFGAALTIEGCTGLHWHPTLEAHEAYVTTLPRYELGPVRETESGFGAHKLAKVRAS